MYLFIDKQSVIDEIERGVSPYFSHVIICGYKIKLNNGTICGGPFGPKIKMDLLNKRCRR